MFRIEHIPGTIVAIFFGYVALRLLGQWLGLSS